MSEQRNHLWLVRREWAEIGWSKDFLIRRITREIKSWIIMQIVVLISRDETIFHTGNYKWNPVTAVPEQMASNISFVAFHFVINPSSKVRLQLFEFFVPK